MANEEIRSYIQKAREYGLKDDEIRKNLAASGWDPGLINEAFSEPLPVQTPAAASPAVTPTAATTAVAPAPARSWFRKPAIVIPLVIAVLLIAGGAAAMLSGFSLSDLGFVKPNTVWDNFTKKGASKVYQLAYTLTYTDNGSVGAAEGLDTELKNISVSVQGNGYLNIIDPNNPKSQSDLQYTFKSGNTSFSTGVKYRITDNILYFNVGENPFLNAIFNTGDKKYDWVKVDLKAAKEQVDNLDSGLSKDLSNTGDLDKIKQIWKEGSYLKLKKYIGKEKLGKTSTLHFTGDIDKQAIKTALDKTIDVFADSADKKPSDADRQDVKDIVGQLVDKLEVKELDLWIGQKDFELYKMHFVSNAPAITDIIKASNEATSSAATTNAADVTEARRISDMQQVQTALELFYKDHNGYPEANRGVPQGLIPQYLPAMPVSPAATGNCSDFYNTYWYVTDGNPVQGKNKEPLHSSYKMTFCIGHDTGQYKAGVGIVTPGGITTTTICPNPNNNCFIQTPRPDGPVVIDTAPTEDASTQKIKEIISKFAYNASITYDGTYSDYGKQVNIEVPNESLDLLDMFKNKVQNINPQIPDDPVPDSDDASKQAFHADACFAIL